MSKREIQIDFMNSILDEYFHIEWKNFDDESVDALYKDAISANAINEENRKIKEVLEIERKSIHEELMRSKKRGDGGAMISLYMYKKSLPNHVCKKKTIIKAARKTFPRELSSVGDDYINCLYRVAERLILLDKKIKKIEFVKPSFLNFAIYV
jgi:hypothetical protein